MICVRMIGKGKMFQEVQEQPKEELKAYPFFNPYLIYYKILPLPCMPCFAVQHKRYVLFRLLS